MFDIKQFYDQCFSGEKVDTSAVREYLKSFDRVIIWGSAGLGKAIGRLLDAWGVQELVYWDQRFKEIGNIGERVVEEPFGKEYDKERSLVMYSIPNHVIMKQLMQEIGAHGYRYAMRGDIFYSGTICPYCNGDFPSARQCWMKNECRSVICNRLKSIVISRNEETVEDERIDLTYNCFIINSICNLSCTHCVQYINNYDAARRVNVPADIVCRDIDLWLDLIDSVGTISTMGGETFMHPDIVKIVKGFSRHKNFGFVSFPTNGLYPIKPEQLDGIDDPRVIIAFGAYQHVASEKQLEIYEKNVELVKSYGIAYTESRHLPTWIVPSGIYKHSDDIEYMTQKKQHCLMPPRNLQIRDGRVHVCDRGVALYAMGIADYPEDYYLLTQPGTRLERRQKFREFVDRPFYYTCGHCGSGTVMSAPSAIQGRMDVFDPAAYENRVWERFEHS